MSNPKKIISTEAAVEILKNGDHGILSMVTPEGGAYGVPINYFYDQADHSIYLHCGKAGKKIDCLKANPRVSFTVIGSQRIIEEHFTTEFESVIVTGTASFLEGSDEKREKLRGLCDAITPGGASRRDEVVERYLTAVNIIKITVDQISGKKSVDE